VHSAQGSRPPTARNRCGSIAAIGLSTEMRSPGSNRRAATPRLTMKEPIASSCLATEHLADGRAGKRSVGDKRCGESVQIRSRRTEQRGCLSGEELDERGCTRLANERLRAYPGFLEIVVNRLVAVTSFEEK